MQFLSLSEQLTRISQCLLNIQPVNNVILQIQERVTTSTINYKRNVVSAEESFDELLNKMKRNSEVSSQ